MTLKNIKLDNNLSLSIEFDEFSKNIYNVFITVQNVVGLKEKKKSHLWKALPVGMTAGKIYVSGTSFVVFWTTLSLS